MSSLDPSAVFVLVPDEFGTLAVIDAESLSNLLAEKDTLSEVLHDGSIDMINPSDPEAIAAVRRLTDTGDATTYWGLNHKASDD